MNTRRWSRSLGSEQGEERFGLSRSKWQVYRTEQGSDVGSPLWVMTKEGGAWLLAACQNTGVLDDRDVTPARPIFGES